MKKVLFIGDSSILARKETRYSKIYTSLLKMKNKYEIEISGKTKNTSKEICVNLETFMLHGYQPNVVVLHYGIVDVFPRPYPLALYKVLQGLGLLTKVDIILKKLKMYYTLGDIFNFKEITVSNFKKYSEDIVKKLLNKNVEKIIIIGIIKPSKVLLNSKNIDREILLYNNIYKDLSEKYSRIEYIDMYGVLSEKFTIWDGYHYSEEGSLYLAEEIERVISD